MRGSASWAAPRAPRASTASPPSANGHFLRLARFGSTSGRVGSFSGGSVRSSTGRVFRDPAARARPASQPLPPLCRRRSAGTLAPPRPAMSRSRTTRAREGHERTAGRWPGSATRDARAEAEARIGRPARVLEPSPPAVDEPPWFADDPLAASDPGPVMPIGQGPGTWGAIARRDDGLARWCAERWLGAWRRLEGTPPGYAATRDALHRLAVYAMSPARR